MSVRLDTKNTEYASHRHRRHYRAQDPAGFGLVGEAQGRPTDQHHQGPQLHAGPREGRGATAPGAARTHEHKDVYTVHRSMHKRTSR